MCDSAQSGGSNPINPIIICKDHKGVDGASYPNGYVDSICTAATPTASNYKDGLFSYANAVKKPNPYENGKYYDVYKCIDSGTFDFSPKEGISNLCNKYPWVQDASGTTPTPPPGKSCPDPNHPYWDGTKCTYRPDACNNVGPGGHQNTCQPNACGAGLNPDTRAGQDEANTACKEYYNNDPQQQICCMKNSAPAAPGAPGGSNPGGGTPPAGSGTETEYGHCYHGDSDCAPQYKCNNPSGGASAYCIYRNPSDPTAYCSTSSNTHYCSGSLTGCNQTGLLQGDNYSCQRAGLGSYCCNGSGGSAPAGPVPTAVSGCPGGPGTSYPNSTCQTSSTCPAGTHPGSANNNAACGSGMYCCIDNNYSGSTASTFQASIQTNTCTTNAQCAKSNLGNACVFTNNPNIGVCR